MGGNALKYCGARRFNREEYLPLAREVLLKLRTAFPSNRFVEIPSYFTKESFGDMDILCYTLTSNDYSQIVKVLESEHSIRNSSVISILYKELQVDIIPCEHTDLNVSLAYYSFNDLGNLIGRIFHKMGLKYGHKGLYLPVKDGDYLIENVEVSKNIEDILEYIGLDYKKFNQGFQTLEEIFEFVESSPYFTPSIFSLESLNSVNRIRNRKRDTYMKFMKRQEGKPESYIFYKDKLDYLPSIFDTFPGTEWRYNSALMRLKQQRENKAKFNGSYVSDWTGLVGKELGEFMKMLKQVMDVDSLTREEIYLKVTNIFKDYEKRDNG